MIDDDSPRTKDLPSDVEDATYRANEQRYEQVQRSNPSGGRWVGATVLPGCQEKLPSLDGQRNGLFTQMLLNVWDGGAHHGSHRASEERSPDGPRRDINRRTLPAAGRSPP
jgi:hypothetical protein